MEGYDFAECEAKWRERWEAEGTFRADPRYDDDGTPAPKFYLNMPYPYMNGMLHLGHSYTYMRGEAYCRYKRMTGHNVLFPFAFHCTGAPIITAANRVAEGEPIQLKILGDMGIGPDMAGSFADPQYWAEYFPAQAERDLRLLGVSVDWRRKFITTSLNPRYDRFIQWQFMKLKEKDYVVLGEHPVVWCPKENTPVGDHARSRGEGETPQEFTLLKFRMKEGDDHLVAATLRPETVYGQTNLWVDPDYQYTRISIVAAGGVRENWLVSGPCADKLEEQGRTMERTGTVGGRELLGKTALAPAIERYIPILPSKFCSPDKGTGIVTSVPSDAPDDWMGIRDLQNDPDTARSWGLDDEGVALVASLSPIPIIRSEGWGELPAVEICERMDIRDQHDREKLDAAKKEIYKSGFYTGVMRAECGDFAGLRVEEAKELIRLRLLEEGRADSLWELSGEVVCRCLTPSIVKVVSNQWFLAYGNEEWKEKVRTALAGMRLIPEGVRSQYEHVIGWLRDWACTRELGLGTRLPWDDKWLIESLSDSTLYMAYYILARYFHGGLGYGQTGGGEGEDATGLPEWVGPEPYTDDLAGAWGGVDPSSVGADALDEGFFDHVFLGEGDAGEVSDRTGIPTATLELMRRDFDYWYPFDLRCSGKDLVQNHLTFCIFNHVGVFPDKYRPGGFSVNGFIKVDGQKMSKSAGNFHLLRDILDKYGADVVRFTLASGGDGVDDPNWDSDLARTMGRRLDVLYSTFRNMHGKGREGEPTVLDMWLRSVTASAALHCRECMERMDFRSAIKAGFFDLRNHLRWYMRRCGDDPHRETMEWYMETQVRLLAPFIPHLCEELWEAFGRSGDGLVCDQPYPDPGPSEISPEAELAEKYLTDVMADVAHIRKLVKGGAEKVVIYTAPDWKWVVRDAGIELALEAKAKGGGLDMGALMKHPDVQARMKEKGKLIGKFAGSLVKELNGRRSELESMRGARLDEKASLAEASEFLAAETGLMVEVYGAEDEGCYDPRGKAGAASPMRPAILME